ncbi:uncharacterized protein LOC127010942 [Drosophila biarmipes]|uniref:uncharacterized protein LOC127010942 n=1 Tax=Drosophila biarmipes TaxID=125945 RepID=UPI0021CCF3A6|nr:uncharacterized protein LOC127010942 [Drosophila biarmipes]
MSRAFNSAYNIALAYRDANGIQYNEAVDDGLDGETLIETGTANDSNIDYDWVPQETLRALQKSPPKSKTPKTSPKPGKQASPKAASQQSPKQRKVKRWR